MPIDLHVTAGTAEEDIDLPNDDSWSGEQTLTVEHPGGELAADFTFGSDRLAQLGLRGEPRRIVDGALAARCRIQVTDRAGIDRNGLIAAVRHYNPDPAAAMLLNAGALTPINHSVVSGQGVTSAQLQAGKWTSMLATDLSDGRQLTHHGAYRLICRASASAAGARLRLLWGLGAAARYATNPEIAFPAAGGFYLMDLGTVTLDAPPIGPPTWRGVVQSQAAGTVTIQKLVLVPLEYASMAYNVTPGAPPEAMTDTASPSSAASTGPGPAWTTQPPYTTAGAGDSQVLALTGTGFDIPADATVRALTVTLAGQITAAGVQARPITGSGPAAGSLIARAGQPVDLLPLLDETFTADDVNDPGFGVQFQTLAAPGPTSVSTVTVTVAYTYGPGATVEHVLYANRMLELRTDGTYNTPDGENSSELLPVEGDVPRLPSGGLEQTPAELLLITSRGNIITTDGQFTLPDPVTDDEITVRALYQPTWLFPP